MLLVTFADPKASRVLWPHFGAEDGVGKPKGLQRGGDSSHEGCRGGNEYQNRIRSMQWTLSLLQIKFKVGLQAGQNKGASQTGQNLGTSRHM